MVSMFQGAENFNQPVNHFDIRKVTSLQNMFYNNDDFNQPVYNWNTSGVTNFSQVFALCGSFEQTLSGFTITSGTSFAGICSLADINAVGTTTNYDETLIAWADQTPISTGESATFSSNFGGDEVDSGTTNGTTTDKLVDTTQNFSSTVTVGDVIYNTTDQTYAFVDAVDSNTILSLSVDIMISGENYTIYHSDAAKGKATLILDWGWSVADSGSV
jgi:surface protein